MSSFEVIVRKIIVSAHPDPETTALEIGKVNDYNVVIGKGIYNTGDLIAYIPESSLVPANIIEELKLTGRLAGSDKNRVKAIKLRGIVSQGLCYPAKAEWVEGQDVTLELGITKWIPTVPVHMAGEVGCCETNFHFDIENIKKYPDLFLEDERVIVTEKLHGTCTIFGWMPEELRKPDMIDGKYIIISKGQATKGLYFKDNEKNLNNLYIKTLKTVGMVEKFSSLTRAMRPELERYLEDNNNIGCPIWILGETFGNGVQDLKYGHSVPTYRAFGIKYGNKWLSYERFLQVCEAISIPTVPVIYDGPFKKDLVDSWTNGKTIEGNSCHIREGVVIASNEYRETSIGRPILKSVSPDYLLRKGDVSEFE